MAKSGSEVFDMLLKSASMRGLQKSENFPPFRQRQASWLSRILASSNTYNQKDACDDRLCVQITVESSRYDAARNMDHKPQEDYSTGCSGGGVAGIGIMSRFVLC